MNRRLVAGCVTAVAVGVAASLLLLNSNGDLRPAVVPVPSSSPTTTAAPPSGPTPTGKPAGADPAWCGPLVASLAESARRTNAATTEPERKAAYVAAGQTLKDATRIAGIPTGLKPLLDESARFVDLVVAADGLFTPKVEAASKAASDASDLFYKTVFRDCPATLENNGASLDTSGSAGAEGQPETPAN